MSLSLPADTLFTPLENLKDADAVFLAMYHDQAVFTCVKITRALVKQCKHSTIDDASHLFRPLSIENQLRYSTFPSCGHWTGKSSSLHVAVDLAIDLAVTNCLQGSKLSKMLELLYQINALNPKDEGHQARKNVLVRTFLHDQRVIAKIVRSVNPRAGDIVVKSAQVWLH